DLKRFIISMAGVIVFTSVTKILLNKIKSYGYNLIKAMAFIFYSIGNYILKSVDKLFMEYKLLKLAL
ncbi:hypothetical protein, partial [Clostridium perfringens]|uniref:hypothetical protein n=1 Tax=Clostridium perfringens TaxID=1502 RepID=UPI002ACBDBBD